MKGTLDVLILKRTSLYKQISRLGDALGFLTKLVCSKLAPKVANWNPHNITAREETTT